VGKLFEQWLTEHFPERADKVLNQVRGLRGGALNDPRYGTRMRGEGILADHLAKLFAVACRKAGLAVRGPALSVDAFRVPASTPEPRQRILPF
jgi:hypothetical protein